MDLHYDKTYREDEDEHEKRKRRLVIILIILLVLLLLIGVFAWWLLLPHGATGSRILPSFTSDVREAQAALDESVQKSRITVSLIPNPALDEQTGTLALNFVVSPDNNGFAERFVIEQDGRTVYQSERVMPGYALATVQTPDAHVGEATATVYAVDADGNDYGNPVSVELVIRAQQ